MITELCMKTRYLTIAPKSKKSCSKKLRVKIGEQIIPKKSSVDYELQWSLHIDDVIKKLANAARIWCKI